MAETAPQLAPLPDDLPPLAFADLDGAKKWAKSLPLLPVAQAYEALIGQLRALSAADVPAARARDDRRGVARAGVPSAHRARAPLCGQAAARRRPRARGRRAGDRAVAGAVGAVLDVPEAAARGRRRARRASRRSCCSAACTSASSWSSCTGSRAALPPATLWQELHAYYRLAEMLECAVHGGVRRPRAARRRHVLLLDVQPRAAAWRWPIPAR